MAHFSIVHEIVICLIWIYPVTFFPLSSLFEANKNCYTDAEKLSLSQYVINQYHTV